MFIMDAALKTCLVVNFVAKVRIIFIFTVKIILINFSGK